MKDLRILIVSHAHPHMSKGGGELAAFQLFEELDGRPGLRAAYVGAAPSPRAADAQGPSFRVLGNGNEILWNTRTLPFHLGNAHLAHTSAQLRLLLESFRPDVVNFHHYFRVGVEAIAEVKRYSATLPVVVTLHEYLAICHRDGQMVKSDGRLCERSTPSGCAACFPDRSAGEFVARKRYIQRYFDQVDRFVSPSRFLIERYVDWGLPREKFRYIENGQRPVNQTSIESASEPALSATRQPTRFAYFGQLTSYKGVDLLLEAIAAIPEPVRRTVRVELHGFDLSDEANPFVRRLQELLEPVKEHVVLGGPYEPAQLGGLMARNDWIVVPSLWWENSPLVVQEAFKHGRPVICADIGGMAEKVRHLHDGLHFRARSATDLARTMTDAANSPELWARLARQVPTPPSVGQCADEYLQVFTGMLPDRARAAPVDVRLASPSLPEVDAHAAGKRKPGGLRAFFAGDFEAYARSVEDHEHALWFFLHIPKTAGSSFWHELASAKQPGSNIAIDYDPNLTGEASRARALSGFLEELSRGPIRAARGHFLYESLGRLRDACSGLRLITMLRNPIDRVVSDFRYSRTPAHPPYLEVIRRYPTIEHYIHAPETQNKMVKFLRSDADEPMPDLIERVTEEFAFIGTTELYATARLVLFRLLKEALPRRLQHRRKTETLSENAVELTNELRAAIEKVNGLDMELYEHFAARWSLQQRAIEEWLGGGSRVARAEA